MEPVIQPDQRADAIDREKFREMLESESFRMYTLRVSRELVRTMADCQRLDEPRDIWRAQGASQMIEGILRIPAVMLQEMEPKPKKR